MSTRAVYTFIDRDTQVHSVYIHHDGYPEGSRGGVAKIANAIPLAWPLPRFEADEFAAAFVAANKKGPGSVRLTAGPEAHGDLAFTYKLVQAINGQLILYVTEDGVERYRGRLKDALGDFDTMLSWDYLTGPARTAPGQYELRDVIGRIKAMVDAVTLEGN